MDIPNELRNLSIKWFNTESVEYVLMPESGSNRQYFRISSSDKRAVGVYNEDIPENKSFFHITEKLANAGVNVPKIYIRSDKAYLQEDLGNVTLYEYLLKEDVKGNPEKIIEIYKKIIDVMPKIQYEAAQNMDFSTCYPRKAFDRQSIQWDLNYFKYFFLKTTYVPFHEEELECDFHAIIDRAMAVNQSFFLYRDFQSRNIMIKEGGIYFIDYQGGRKGALEYDLASLLFEAKTNLTLEMRKELIDYYCNVYSSYEFFNKVMFMKSFSVYALIRILQAFGAYGYRGIYERKVFFIKSILPAIENLNQILNIFKPDVEIPHLTKIINSFADLKKRFKVMEFDQGLTISIYSFAYKNGIPEDYTGNGGGFVFDCRSLPNPGRYEEYNAFTGLDKEVISFLEPLPEINVYLKNVKNLVSAAVSNYLFRGFNHLQVSFGCTGGQHRSVYMAEKLKNFLKDNFPVRIRLIHREQDKEEYYEKNNV